MRSCRFVFDSKELMTRTYEQLVPRAELENKPPLTIVDSRISSVTFSSDANAVRIRLE